MSEKREFYTFQPATIRENNITEPTCFNGMCLVREYKVTIEEVDVDTDTIRDRLIHLYLNAYKLGISHYENMKALRTEAKKVGLDLSKVKGPL